MSVSNYSDLKGRELLAAGYPGESDDHRRSCSERGQWNAKKEEAKWKRLEFTFLFPRLPEN
jgi:hypothetical protein